MLLYPAIGLPLEYETPPVLRVERETCAETGKPLWLVMTDDGEEVACLASQRAARDLVADYRRTVAEAANDDGEVEIALNAFLSGARDIHPRYRDEWVEQHEPEAVDATGAHALEGVDIIAVLGSSEYPQQRDFLRSTRRHALNLGGRGTGKSHALGAKALILALLNPGCEGLLLSRSYMELHSVLLRYFRAAVKRFHDETGIDVVAHESKSLHRITLINGAMVWLRSWDRVDKVRSFTVAWAALDEIEHGQGDPMYAYTTVNACIRQAGAVVHQFAIATTPNGLTGVAAHFLVSQRDEAGKPPAERSHYVSRATVYDNPYVDEAFRESLRKSMTPRQWQQEGLGRILGPVAQVLVEYEEARHVVSWKWRNDLPWIVVVDWGTSHAFIAHVQIEPRSGNPYGYRWVVAWERKLEDVGVVDVRQAVEDSIAMRSRLPELIAGDRAKPDEMRWAVGRFRGVQVRGCDTASEQDIVRGLAHVRFMLAPPDGDEPLLVLSDELPKHMHTSGRGLRGAAVNYRYRLTVDGVQTNTPLKDDINDHPIDALRYGVVTSAHMPALHGGRALRSLYTEAWSRPNVRAA